MGIPYRPSREVIARRIKEAGLKCTRQRLAIYEAVASTTTHPSVDEIYARVRNDNSMLSLNTVYTTLETLKGLGLVKEMRSLDTAVRYDANVENHHHVICLGCRKISDFEDTVLDRVKPPLAIRRSYRLVSHTVTFYGYCETCHKKGVDRRGEG